MLVSELKKELDKYNQKEMMDIIVELYKRIPKNVKESYGIDSYIIDIKNNVKKGKSDVVSFDELKKDIVEFLDNVNDGYYYNPNNIIPKKERSGWRFKVKKYCKELNSYLPNTDDGYESTKLLIEIYKILNKAGCYYIFPTSEPFRAIGIEQEVFYDNIIRRIASNGLTDENINLCVELLYIDNQLYTNMYDMVSTIINNLTTVESRNKAIEMLKNEVIDIKEKMEIKKEQRITLFELEEKHNRLVEYITCLCLNFENIDNGIKYFQKNYIEKFTEIREYKLLNIIEKYELYDDWMKEYEAHKIKYREELQEKYEKFKKLYR